MLALVQHVVIGLAAILYLSGALVLINGCLRLSDWGGVLENFSSSTSSPEGKNLKTSVASPTRPTYFLPASEACVPPGSSAAGSPSLIGARGTAPVEEAVADRDLALKKKSAHESLLLQSVCLN